MGDAELDGFCVSGGRVLFRDDSVGVRSGAFSSFIEQFLGSCGES